jgi:hypothetical protein
MGTNIAYLYFCVVVTTRHQMLRGAAQSGKPERRLQVAPAALDLSGPIGQSYTRRRSAHAKPMSIFAAGLWLRSCQSARLCHRGQPPGTDVRRVKLLYRQGAVHPRQESRLAVADRFVRSVEALFNETPLRSPPYRPVGIPSATLRCGVRQCWRNCCWPALRCA